MSTRREWLIPGLTATAVVLGVIVAAIVYAATRDRHVVAHGGASPSASASALDQPYRCWNGEGAASLALCSDPAGMKGLDWVLPGHEKAVEDGGCAQQDTGPRNLFVECSLTWRGHQVYLDYAYWGAWVDGQDEYEKSGATPLIRQRSDGGTSLFWRPRKMDITHDQRSWRTAEMIQGKGWTFAVYAASADVAEAAMSEFGEIRDLREWRGLPR